MRERTKRRYKRYYRNFKEVKIYMLLRLITVFCVSFVCSAGYILLGKAGIKGPEMLVLFVLVFLILDIVFMRKSYYRMAHLRKYIMVEAIPHVIYAIVGIVMAKIMPYSIVYKMLFSVTDVFEFSVCNISQFVSTVIFNVILLLAIRFVPLSMKWVHISHG